MSEQLSHQPTEAAQALHEAMDHSLELGNQDQAYGWTDSHSAVSSSDKLDHYVQVDRRNLSSYEFVNVQDINVHKDDGKEHAGVEYKSYTAHPDKWDDESKKSNLVGPDDTPNIVEVNRLAANPRTGKDEAGVVTKLTGERAQKAKEILNRRAARSLGQAAAEKTRAS